MGIRQGLATAQGRRQGGGNHFAQGSVGVTRQPMQRVGQLAADQRRRIQPLQRRAQGGRVVGLADAFHHAHQLTRAERHPQAPAHVVGGRCRAAFGWQVIEQLR
ncbi:hypothetical protein D3C81_1527820 [compost metagenome]